MRYIENGGLYAEAFRPYLNQVGSVSLADDAAFKNLLRLSARKDAVMRSMEGRSVRSTERSEAGNTPTLRSRGTPKSY